MTRKREPEAFPAYLYSNAYNDKGRYLFNQTVALQALALYRQSYPFSDEAVLSAVWPAWHGGAWHEGLRHWMAWMETTVPSGLFEDYNTPANRIILKAEIDSQKAQREHEQRDWRGDGTHPFGCWTGRAVHTFFFLEPYSLTDCYVTL